LILYWVIKISFKLSIFIVSLSEFSKVNGSMAKCAILEFEFFNLTLVHFMFASLASIVVSGYNRFSTYNTSWEVATTRLTNCIILADGFFTISSGAFYSFSRSLFRRVFCKDTNCNFNISLFLFSCSHSFKFYKGSRTLLIALNKWMNTLL